MLRKLSCVSASIMAFAFVFVSIAHACSGLTSMNPATQQSPMSMGGNDSPPCGKAKPDICKSVRDSMLCVKPSVSGPEQTVAPAQHSADATFVLLSTPVTRIKNVNFHPVFKLPLSLSYRVLRI